MLTFKLIDIVNGYYHYEIYPEGKIEDVQTFIFSRERQEVKYSTFTEWNKKYLGHFIQALNDENGNMRVEGMAAWV